jgi:dCMP deaminase
VRPDWHRYFLDLAQAVAARADCTRRQVGAVLVERDTHRVLSTGYNGAPSGVPGCLSAGACPRGHKTHAEVPRDVDYRAEGTACIALHAEWNAVMFSRERNETAEAWRARIADAVLYVSDEPCPQCYALLEAVGIRDVAWPEASS